MRFDSRLFSVPALLVCMACFSASAHAAPAHLWSHGFVATDDLDAKSRSAVAMDAVGNVVITGTFLGTVNFGGAPLSSQWASVFLAKYDANGNYQWSKAFGGGLNFAYGLAIATDGSGEVIIGGKFSGTVDFGGGPLTSIGTFDLFLAKYDANGAHLWSQRFGPGNDHDIAITTDVAGDVVACGFYTGNIDFGGGPLPWNGQGDLFVAKFGPAGNHLWSLGAGDAADQVGTCVAVDGSGNIAVGGHFQGQLLGQFNIRDPDIFTATFDTNGNLLASHKYGDRSSQHCTGIAFDGAGNFFITGYFDGVINFGAATVVSGGTDMYLAKFDAAGTNLWGKSWGGDTSEQFARGVATDTNGNVLMTGDFDGAIDFGGGAFDGTLDAFIAQFDGDGNHLWSLQCGSVDANGIGYAVATHGATDFALAGYFAGNVDFGGGPLGTIFEEGPYAAKFGTTPLPVLITSFKAARRNGDIEIDWNLWSDEGIESFTLYRREQAGALAVIAEGASSAGAGSYLDTTVEPAKTYQYELVVHTSAGADFRSPIATVSTPALATSLGQNHPNPFNPSTTIDFVLSERTRAVIDIYDAAGALVTRIDAGAQDAGSHAVEWQGRDSSGHAVVSGVYFYLLEGEKNAVTRKMVLLK